MAGEVPVLVSVCVGISLCWYRPVSVSACVGIGLCWYRPLLVSPCAGIAHPRFARANSTTVVGNGSFRAWLMKMVSACAREGKAHPTMQETKHSGAVSQHHKIPNATHQQIRGLSNISRPQLRVRQRHLCNY